ncbi:MAG: EcsC family protein [Bacteroidota bacterium]|nr:EcsC family protein [Bacteroidota bacterium]MDE2958201.1 EcsC family protein [Bacteroidota bacterium]
MLTASEQAVLAEVRTWRSRQPAWVDRQVSRINRPLKQLSGMMHKVPGFDWTLDNLITGVVRITNEIAQDTVSWKGVLERFRARGHDIASIADVRSLKMEAIHEALEGIQMRYQSMTGAQGAAAGLAGLAGLLPDLLGLIGFSLRAAGETATCCGFDLSREHEREYALFTLCVAARTDDSRDAAGAIARHHTRQTAEQLAVKGSMYGLARALGQRLIGLKAAQFLPVAGMVVGGGSNAWYTARVCETARHLYRERLIYRCHPAAIIDACTDS